MTSPLLALVFRLFGDERGDRDDRDGRDGEHGSGDYATAELPGDLGKQPSDRILMVLRRMRAPLIVLIVVFAVSVLGLSLIPGRDPQGRPDRMSLFESFYFMSYTATTIGFGELPHSFTPLQRMWVTFAIFLSVIGWAYGIGSLLALMQDRSVRRVLARRRFTRQVAQLREPFLILVGYGRATKRLARSLDDMGHRFVIIDREEVRVAGVDLDSYRADTPAMVGDARDTSRLVMAGVGHPWCEGVVALAGDEETNLDVAMTTALLRPQLPVIARTHSRDVAERMKMFGSPTAINPFDRFGDHLRILYRSPASYQLMMWLTSAPGTPLPPRHAPLPRGRWVVYGTGRFGRELADDLRAEDIEVTVVGERRDVDDQEQALADARIARADVGTAAAFVAATESDTTNLWLVEAAHRANPDLFIVALQNRAGNSPLFDAVHLDFGMQPADVIVHEVLARLANPALMRFLPEVPRHDDAWAAELLARLVDRCGNGTPEMWVARLSEDEAPALTRWLHDGGLRLGDLLRSLEDRDLPARVVPLALVREGRSIVTPGDDELLHPDDRLLLAGTGSARRSLDAVLGDEPTATFVIEGRVVPSGWLWRRLSGANRS
jgi:Trk K+ transport system NAD-binding subunit